MPARSCRCAVQCMLLPDGSPYSTNDIPGIWRQLRKLHRQRRLLRSRPRQPPRREFRLLPRRDSLQRQEGAAVQARSNPCRGSLGLLQRRGLWRIPRYRQDHNVRRLSDPTDTSPTRVSTLLASLGISHPQSQTHHTGFELGDRTPWNKYLVRGVDQA